MQYILRDSTYFVRSIDGGSGGAPVWCTYPFYAHRFDTLESAQAAAKVLDGSGWDVEPRQLTGDDIGLLNPKGDLCYVCGPDPIADRPCVACGS